MLRTARRLVRFRPLVATLTAREIKARYRGSVLGFLWSLVNPLLLLGVYSFAFGVIFQPGRGTDAGAYAATDPYALFLVTGLFPWIWVSGSVLEAATSLTANAGLIKKAVFPAEVLPVVSVLANGVHFLFALPILGAALVAGRLLGYPVGGLTALALPAVILIQLPMLAGLGLAVAALHAHFKDTRDLVANALTLLFFLTPILYPIEAVGAGPVATLLRVNPFTAFTEAYQAILFYGRLPGPEAWGLMVLASAVSWVVGSALFDRLSDTLVEAV